MQSEMITHRFATVLAILWASPATLLGLTIGLTCHLFRARGRRKGRVIEFWGGGIAWLLKRLPIVRGAFAMTLGHVVLGQTIFDLDRTREHELVHVRQYERWGPFMIPAYLASSLICWLRGQHPYLDNVFEREAYEKAP